MLRQLQAAAVLDDLHIPPGNRLEALQGDRAGQYSIRIKTPFDDSVEDAANKYSPRDYDSVEEYEADTHGSLDGWDRQ